jgi:hypothetical protein
MLSHEIMEQGFDRGETKRNRNRKYEVGIATTVTNAAEVLHRGTDTITIRPAVDSLFLEVEPDAEVATTTDDNESLGVGSRELDYVALGQPLHNPRRIQKPVLMRTKPFDFDDLGSGAATLVVADGKVDF